MLRLGSDHAERPCDLLRVGRQPETWSDDDRTAAAARRHALRFEGRPPSIDDPKEAQTLLMRQYASARYVLAFSNTMDPRRYTHTTRAYITGRWTDALACGAAVAGVPAAQTGREVDRRNTTLFVSRNPPKTFDFVATILD